MGTINGCISDFEGQPVAEGPEEVLSPGSASNREAAAAESLLATCPDRQKGEYRKMALRAVKSSRAAAMRLKCLDCVAWVEMEVRLCSIEGCPLWRYRMKR